MRVSEAVTDAGGLWFVFGGAVLLYAALGTFAVMAIRKLARDADAADEDGPDDDLPYSPPPAPPPAATGAG